MACTCTDYDVCSACRKDARQAYKALSCKGKQDCDAFFGHREAAASVRISAPRGV